VSNPSTATAAYNYAYDPVGNRWTQTIPSTCSGCTGPQPSYNFDGKNRITSASGIIYDAAGNVINDGTHTYTYDAENRMITVDGSTQAYFYDAFGRQVQTIYGGSTYSRIFGLNGRAEVQFVGNTWMLSELYAGSVGDYLGNYSNNKTYFAHSDQVGSRRMYTDPTGSSVETCTGLPFGDAGTCAGSGPASPTGFTGQDGDPNTNLTRFPFRNYSMQQGRWMHPDPAGLAAVDPGNPQTWNGYAYVTNNPLSYIDPLGLLDDPIVCPASIGSCGGGGDSYGTSYTIDGVEVSASMVQAALGSGFGVFGPANAGYGHSQAGANGGSYTLIAVAGDSWAWVNNYNGEELSPEAAAEAGLNGTMPGESTSTGPPDPTNMDKALFCNKRLRKQAGRAFGVTQNGTARSGLAEAGFSIELGSNGLAFGPMVNSVYSDGIANQLGIVTGPGTIAILHTHGNMVLPTPSSGDLNSVFPNFVVSRYSWYVTVPATHKYVELNSSACR
jgi:RHS repeat-associated protein